MIPFLLAALVAMPQQMDSAQLSARIDTIVGTYQRNRDVPGVAVVVMRDGHVVHAKGYGVANIELETAFTAQTPYLLASITKSFTATMTMMLVREGKIALDAPISTYLGTVPASWNRITVRHLLTHTGGLQDRFELASDGRMLMSYTAAQMMEAAAATKVDFPPGSRFQYSDQGYFLLGAILEKVTGKRYRELLRERVFTPAGMTAATTHNPLEIVKGRASGYNLVGQTLINAPRAYQFAVVSHYGIIANAMELARFGSALLGNTLLPATMRDSMWTTGKLNDGSSVAFGHGGYGFGFFLDKFNGRRIVYHEGSTGTCLYLLPDDRTVIAVLTNLEQLSGSAPSILARNVAQVYVPELRWIALEPTPDPDSTFTLRLRAELQHLAKGEMDSTFYASAYAPVIRASLPNQVQGLGQLGPLTSIVHLRTEAVADERSSFYRAMYGDRRVFIRTTRDRNGRVVAITAQ